MYFSKLLFILYKVPMYIRRSSTLAYTVNKCTPALWLRFIGLPWRRVSGQLNSGCLSLMPPPGSTRKLQALRYKPGQLCWCKELHASSSLPQCWTALLSGTAQNFAQLLRAKSCPWERITGLRQDVSKYPGSSSQGRTETDAKGSWRAAWASLRNAVQRAYV